MYVRKLAIVVGLIGALGADFASALGLGEIKLNSTLNQPLDAEIKLLQARDLTEEEILIRLAAREDFERAGVERVFFLSDIKFTVELNNRTGPIVRLTSSKPVREPFLNFLLETQWPSGRLLREYTLLMDLPVFSSEAVRPIQGAQTQPSPQATLRNAPEPVREQPRQAAPRQPEPVGRAEPQRRVDVYGPVSEDDTLWEIALKVRPDRSTSVQQTMLAMQRLNPDAFINDNINLLRKGQVLRIPDWDQIYELSAQQAIDQVAEQNADWSRETGAQLEGGRRVASGRPTQALGQGRVSLATPGSAESTASGKGSGAAQGDVEAMENDLAITLEELDKSRRENAELTSRIKDLEAQISTMERLVDVSNQELRALQLASQNSAAAAEETPPRGVRQPLVEEEALGEEQRAGDPGQLADDPEQQLTGDPEQQGAEDPEQRAAVAEPPPAAAVREPPRLREPAAEEDTSRTTVRSGQGDKSLLDLLLENITWIGGGLLALLAGVMLFMRRRAQLASEEELDELDALPENDFFEDSDIEEEEAYSDERLVANEDMEHESNLEGELATAAEEDDSSVEPETGDVVGEADIYIAYGKFDQAEEMLRKALEDEPDRIDVHLKLLEVYAESKNLDKFDQQYGHLLTYNDEGANQRAAELRLHFPDAGKFNTGTAAAVAVAAPAAAAAVADEFAPERYDSLAEPEAAADDSDMSMDDMDDLSLDLDLDLDLEEEDEKQTAAEAGDLDFDLDLDLDLDTDVEETPEAAAAGQEGATDFDLDLDLDEEPSADTYEEPSADAYEEPSADAYEEPSADAYEEPSADNYYKEPSADNYYKEPSADNYYKEEPAPTGQVAADEFDLELDPESGKTAESRDDLAAMDSDTAESDQDFDLDFSTFDDAEPHEKAAANLDFSHREPARDSRPAQTVETAQEDFSAQGEEFELDLDDFSGDDLAGATLGQEDAMGFEDDDFDLDMGDIDMAALDQEVESMEADFDFGELGDDEFDLSLEGETKKPAMREPVTDFDLSEEVQPANEERHSAADMDEDFFTEALSGVPEMEKMPASANGNGHGHGALVDEDAELDFLADTDEAATKLDLARAYIDMGDKEGAKDILDEVAQEGDDRQRQEAQDLLAKIG